MKQKLLLFLICCMSGLWAYGQGPSAARVLSAPPVPATHLKFDGANDYIDIGNLVSSGSSYTKEAWINTANIMGANIISSGTAAFWFWQGNIQAGNGGGFIDVYASASSLSDTWNHIAVTYNDTTHTMRLYINGAMVSQNTNVGSYNGGNIQIGAFNGGSVYTGSIDEVRIWNIALPQEDINRRKSCELQGNEPGLVAYYTFNQGLDASGNSGEITATDASGNGHDGTLRNFALTGTTSNWVSGSPVTTGIPMPSAPTASAQQFCPGATVADLVANGSGGTLHWYNAATDDRPLDAATVLATGTYYVAEANANGCESIRIPVAVSVFNIAVTATTLTCHGEATATASVQARDGGLPYAYAWSNGANTASISGLPAGKYKVVVTAANACNATDSVSINDPAAVAVTSVAVPGNDTYKENDRLAFTIHYSEAVTVSGTPELSLGMGTSTVTATYQSGSGTQDLLFRYTVTATDQAPGGIQVGTLSLQGGTLQNANGCTALLGLNNVGPTSGVKVHNLLPQTITFATLADKTYGDADFDPGATASSGLPVTYTSDDPAVVKIVSGKLHILAAGTATITASQDGNTDYPQAANVTQQLVVAPKAIQVTAATQSKTYGAADPALTYTFMPALVGEDVFTGALERTAGEHANTYPILLGTLSAGANYRLTYTGANLVIGKALLQVKAGDASICTGDAFPDVTLDYTGFKNGDNAAALTKAPTVSEPAYSTAGQYPLLPAGGVAKDYSFTYQGGSLTVLAAPDGSITQTPLPTGAAAGYQLAAPAGAQYAWNTLETTPVINAYTAGTYMVRVTAADGCSADFSTTVNLETITIPNTFSPNGDGINDRWSIPALRNNEQVGVVIVDRDGQVVFESKHFSSWDGKRVGGNTLPAGVYFYRVVSTPGVAPLTGWINLVR